MVDGAEASSLTVFSGYRFVRCTAAHEAGSVVATAGFDPLRDDGDRYAAALRAAGTRVDLRPSRSLTHGFAGVFPLGGGSAVTTTELVSALRAHLSRV
jgi:acetyl esterase